jgi:hypothetical protein
LHVDPPAFVMPQTLMSPLLHPVRL